MKISYNWLKEYVNTDLSPEQIAEILTDTGLEVEGITQYETVKGGLEGLVIGEVTSCKKHPDADKLSVTTVNTGSKGELPIVCGAPNVAEGQKVVVAPVGTTLFPDEEGFKIKKTKIRGEVSEGMICAEDEIGMGDSHEGIMVLDKDAPVGKELKDYFHIEKDKVLEIDLTPNRIDGASHIGTARDLVAVLKQKNDVELKKPSVKSFEVDHHDLKVDIKIENTNDCPRYSGVTLTGVKTAPSPQWLQDRLKAIGLNPINNLVDISNFVLHETGHPLHFFDADQIKGNQVIIKNLREGHPFTTLDGEEVRLSSEDLMICNAEEPMCIAGILGGTESGVTENTRNLFIESAYFNPIAVRKTAKRHGLNTDASYRFERGADPNNTVYALKRAALLVKEIAGGSISSEIIDKYPIPVHPKEVELSYSYIHKITGNAIDKQKITDILESLDIQVIERSTEGVKVKIPTYRADVTREIDVIEEILRIYGYNNIQIDNRLVSSIVHSEDINKEKYKETISNLLSDNGFREIMSNSLTKSSYYDKLETFPEKKLVYLHNPLSSDLNSMRQSLLFGGLEAISYNTNHQRADLKLYELGNCYSKNKDNPKERDPDVLKPFNEQTHLALFMTGKEFPESWTQQQEEVSFYHLKAYVENILDKLGFNRQKIKTDEFENEIFSQGITLKLKKHILGEMGILSPELLKKFDIENDVYFAELYWETLVQLSANNTVQYEPVSKFPEVRRDLALLIDENTRFKEIYDLAYQAEKKFLKDISLFDVYQGDKIEKGKKSYAVSFLLQDKSQTLKDKQIDKIMDKLIKTFKEKLGAEIR